MKEKRFKTKKLDKAIVKVVTLETTDVDSLELLARDLGINFSEVVRLAIGSYLGEER